MKKSALAIATLVLICACSPQPQPHEVAEKAGTAVENNIIITKPRVRLPMGGADMTAGYVSLHNNNSHPIILKSAQTDIAARIEFHTNEKSPDGMMQMRQADNFVIPAGGDLILAPMGNHFMIFDTKPNLKAGDIANITLVTDKGEKITFKAPVVEDMN